MSAPISPVALKPAPVEADPRRAEKLHEAARDFESLLVKQLLTAAKIGGDPKGSGYADMAVDALAKGIEKGGGMGLAKRIEDTIAHSLHHASHKPNPVDKAGGR
jgi:Rod binding domain-containing protein